MQLIDGNTAHHGLTIAAEAQTNGKGQRGRSWVGEEGNSVLMSIIVTPVHLLADQFLFNASVAVAVANVLKQINSNWQVSVKWPNDIILNDKKAGGILIENVLRGHQWVYSVIGIGLNVNQTDFLGLPFATSMRVETDKWQSFFVDDILEQIRSSVLGSVNVIDQNVLLRYNEWLYKRGKTQTFIDIDGNKRTYSILNAEPDGTLSLQDIHGKITNIRHGDLTWEYS